MRPLSGVERLHEHRRIWQRKPALPMIYGVWFDALQRALPARGRFLEIGAGPGFLAAHLKSRMPEARVVAMDLLPVPWNDLAGDGMRMPFPPASMDAALAVDFVHHLAYPERFFSEAARVLRPGARLLVVEPWISPLSYLVYRFLHQERCRIRVDPWRPFESAGGASKDAFDGDAALPWRLVRDTPDARWRELGFEPPRVDTLNGFAYLLSLGFWNASLLPAALAPLVLGLDVLTRPLAALVAMRGLVCWTRV